MISAIRNVKTHTLLSLESLYSTHRLMDFLQYSTVKASVYSWPWPLPHRPWVSVHVTKWSSSRSISKYSLTSLLICAFGHHAPPFFSWRILKTFTNMSALDISLKIPVRFVIKYNSLLDLFLSCMILIGYVVVVVQITIKWISFVSSDKNKRPFVLYWISWSNTFSRLMCFLALCF